MPGRTRLSGFIRPGGWERGSPLLLLLFVACGTRGATGDGGDGGHASSDAATPADGAGGANQDASAAADRAIDASGTSDGMAADAVADGSRDATRPTPKLTWTLMTPGWDAALISGAANGEIWIATRAGGALQIRANGTSAAFDLMLLGSAYPTDVWVAGPDNVYIAAFANLVLHWDGSGTWKRDIMPSGTTFSSIWGSGPTDIHASGGGGPYRSTGDDRWTAEPVLETTTAGIGPLRGTGPTDLWLAGIYGEIFRSGGDGLWRREISTGVFYVKQIWAATPSEAYFVTYNTIMHRLPTTGGWVADATPVRSTENMNCLWGTGITDVYAGTDQGRLFHSVGDGVWQDEGFDPGAGVTLSIKGIWSRSASDVYLATSNGIYHGVP